MSLFSSYNPKPHVVLFPFMSKGHNIPLLHLARLLLQHGATVTLFTTPGNRPSVVQFISDNVITIIDLPFPADIPELPPGIESTDKLPSMSLFLPFARATRLMQPYFENVLQTLPRVVCIISDQFLHWTLESAMKFGIPRLGFNGMSIYASALSRDAAVNGLLSSHESADEPFTLTSFPWIKLTRNDFDYPFNKRDPSGPLFDFLMETTIALWNSYGQLVNSFYKLEPRFVDYWNRESKSKVFLVGPLCLNLSPETEPNLHQEYCRCIHWLDQKLRQGRPVLYIAFGSQAEISPEQLSEIAGSLEESEVSFLWVVRKDGIQLGDKFEERIKERGMVVKEWVDQKRILEHEIVQGFLSHCGWNSVLESICAEVPILAWPMIAEQHLNARMVVEEIKIGLRVETINGSGSGFVESKSLKNKVKELMEGEKRNELRKNVKELAEMARNSMKEGGSSWLALNQLIKEIYLQQDPQNSKV